jgi:hypothetical protein
MPEFISKLQHNTYEKGEFSEEQARDLTDTIELIRTFPWDSERTLTDIQLTGPSVTIRDEDLNYLKIGLYFNGKFCCYYLDNDNHLYEFHAQNIDEACEIVKEFFDGTLYLDKFEKHIFNIGNQPHFITNYFEYREKLSRVLLLNSFLLIYTVFMVVANAASFKAAGLFPLKLILCLCSGLLLYILGRICYNAFLNRNNYLQISKGNNIFKFGPSEDNVDTYDKNDIEKVVVYETRGTRNPNFVCIYEIYFKNGSIIKFSNMLISDFSFTNKFNPALITYGKKSLLKML